jgi:hypothetical protein
MCQRSGTRPGSGEMQTWLKNPKNVFPNKNKEDILYSLFLSHGELLYSHFYLHLFY